MEVLFLILVGVLLLIGTFLVMMVTGFNMIWIALGLWAAAAMLVWSFQAWRRVRTLEERLEQMEKTLRRMEEERQSEKKDG